MESNTASGHALQRTITSRRAFLQCVGLAGIGLSLGVKRACASPTASLEVLRARLAAALFRHLLQQKHASDVALVDADPNVDSAKYAVLISV